MSNRRRRRSQHLAIDLGGESGRVMLGSFDGSSVSLQEVHRFPNIPLNMQDGPHWNVTSLMQDILTGLTAAAAVADGHIRSVGLDTWGVDYGLVDKHGVLLAAPYHNRHPRTAGMIETAFALTPERQVYEATGSQTVHINTLFQLLAAGAAGELRHAATMLLMPDLFTFWLTGLLGTEATIASTTQLFDPRTRQWATPLIEALQLPARLFQEIREPGGVPAELLPSITMHTGLATKTRFVTIASHDTASAFVAVQPTPSTMVISSGTWSLVGIESSVPIISEDARLANFSNEAGYAGTTRVLRNASGLWLIQACRSALQRQGLTLSYDEITALAESAATFSAVINPDDAAFLMPTDMPDTIRTWCRDTGQQEPSDYSTILRIALEGLALNYRSLLEDIERVFTRQITQIQIAGGGSRNALHCQFTADATGLPVIAGPAEATALGNVMVQALALGEIGSLAEIRTVIQQSSTTVPYIPDPTSKPAWDEAFGRFLRLRSRS